MGTKNRWDDKSKWDDLQRWFDSTIREWIYRLFHRKERSK